MARLRIVDADLHYCRIVGNPELSMPTREMSVLPVTRPPRIRSAFRRRDIGHQNQTFVTGRL